MEDKFRGSSVSFESPNFTFKVIVLGNSGVGKTCFIKRAVNDMFEESHDITIMNEVSHMFCFIDDKKVKLQFWDTCGLEQYRSINKAYYRGSDIALILFDITKEKSFNDCQIVIEELKQSCEKDTAIYLVATKIDLLNREISGKVIKEYAKENKIDKTYEISSRTGQGINDLLEDISQRQINKRLLELSNTESNTRKFSVTRKSFTSKNNCPC